MFAADDLNKAVTNALNGPDIQIPNGKHLAIVTVAHADGSVQAAAAFKQGDHWVFGGEVEWHGGALEAGVSAKASW